MGFVQLFRSMYEVVDNASYTVRCDVTYSECTALYNAQLVTVRHIIYNTQYVAKHTGVWASGGGNFVA